MMLEKGGRNAAFFLFLFAVAVLGFGGSLQHPLAVLRAGTFGAAFAFLWKRRERGIPVGTYPLLVGGFVLLVFGHAFSSTYRWASIQHALNIAVAAVLAAWAFHWFRENPGKAWGIMLSVVAALAAGEIVIAVYQRLRGGTLRPPGTFDNANYLAEFLVAASILIVSRLLWGTGSRRLRTAAGAGVVFLLAAAYGLSGARGVLVASVPAVGILLLLRYGLRRGGALLLGIGLPALLLLGYRGIARFFGPDIHNYSRWIIWKSALRTFLEHPFGVGLGGFKYYWFATQSPVEGTFSRFGKFASTAHSEYLEVLSGLGALGFLLFLAVLVVPLVLAFQRRAEFAPERRPIAAGATGVLVLSGTHALFNANFHVFGIFFLDAVMLGALLACLPERRYPVVVIPGWGCIAGIGLLSVLLLVTTSTVVGAWSFGRGERLLEAGDLPGAERAFRLAASADPYRAVYPDALSAIRYRRSVPAGTGSMPISFRTPVSLDESIRWEIRAATLSPREPKYLQRASSLFAEKFHVGRRSDDMDSALALASRLLEVQPYSAEALWHRSALLASIGRTGAAIHDLERAVALEPNFCRGYAKLAEMTARDAPSVPSAWKEKADACRERAAGLVLEDYERWLVEDPGR